MWFSDQGTTKAIGRITANGTITEFSTGLNPGSNPGRLAPGPDGNMWFVDKGTTKAIGVSPPAGRSARFRCPPPATRTASGRARTATSGSPTRAPRRAIGMINPTTHAVSEFSTGLNPGSVPQIIETGSDGGLWFTDSGTTNAIGPDRPTTHVIQEFSAGMTPVAAPNGISLGADGKIWSPRQGLTSSPASPPLERSPSTRSARRRPAAVAAGTDGNLWFGANGGDRRVRDRRTRSIGHRAGRSPGPTASASPDLRGRHWSTWAGQQPSHDSYIADGYEWLLDGTRSTAPTRPRTHPPRPTRATNSRARQRSPLLLQVTVSSPSSTVEVKSAAEQLATLSSAVTGVGPG